METKRVHANELLAGHVLYSKFSEKQTLVLEVEYVEYLNMYKILLDNDMPATFASGYSTYTILA